MRLGRRHRFEHDPERFVACELLGIDRRNHRRFPVLFDEHLAEAVAARRVPQRRPGDVISADRYHAACDANVEVVPEEERGAMLIRRVRCEKVANDRVAAERARQYGDNALAIFGYRIPDVHTRNDTGCITDIYFSHSF